MQTYSGQLGIVLFCSDAVNSVSVACAKVYAPDSAIDLGSRHRPHITLYHSNLTDVPVDRAEQILDDVVRALPVDIRLFSIATFGGKFVFWDVVCTPELEKLHATALRLGEYFAPAGEQQADKERIVLSPAEEENVLSYGHPLVRDRWRPHITLGYYPTRLEHETADSCVLGGTVTGAGFVRVGEYGTIAEVLFEHRALPWWQKLW